MKRRNVDVKSGLDAIVRKARRQRLLRRALVILSVIMLIATMNQMKFAADTLERIPTCGYEYDHQHDASCYDEAGNLTCGRHVHSDACYQTRPEKSADIEEFEGYDVETVVVDEAPMELDAFMLGEDDAEGLEAEEGPESGHAEDDNFIVKLVDAALPEPTAAPEAEETAAEPETEETAEPGDEPKAGETAEPAAAPEAEEAAEPEEPSESEEPGGDQTYTAIIDLTDSDAPFSLIEWLRRAEPVSDALPGASSAEAAEENYAGAFTQGALPPENWIMEYNTALLAIEPGDEDYSVMPLASIERTVVSVDTGAAAYKLELRNWDGEETPAADGVKALLLGIAEISAADENLELPGSATGSAHMLSGADAGAAWEDVEAWLADRASAQSMLGRSARKAPPAVSAAPVNTVSRTEYRAFDISLDNVDEAEYADGFSVTVTLPEAIQGRSFALYHIHEGEDGKQVNRISDLRLDGADGAVTGFTFVTPDFSQFVLSYTVDFYYGDLEYHLNGGGETRLSELFTALGIDADAADVADVSFTDPELLAVEAVEGDWLFISLQAFDTEEMLTVVFADGSVFEIRVEDAAQRKTITFVVSPSGWAAVRRDSSNNSTSSFSLTHTDSGINIMNPAMNRYYTFAENMPSTNRFDYLFATWTLNNHLYTNSYAISGNSDYAVNPYTDDDVADGSTLTAHFYPKAATVVMFDTEDGTDTMGTVSSNVYFYGSSEDGNAANALPTATPASGYLFAGWYAGDTLVSNNATLTKDALSGLVSGTVLRAKFYRPTSITYATKAFSGNSGAGTVSLIGANSYAAAKSETVPAYAVPTGATAKANNGSRFLYWEDSEGNIVCASADFVPIGDQIRNETYYAVFTNQAGYIVTANDTSLVAHIQANNGGNPSGNDVLNARTTAVNQSYFAWDNSGHRIGQDSTLVDLVYWELTYQHYDAETGETVTVIRTYKDTPQYRADTKENYSEIAVVKAVVKPQNTFIVNYACTTGGTINNTTDYAGSTSAKGVTATANAGEGQRFLGWYIGARRVSTSETISAADLITWKNAGYISEDFTTITAHFGTGATITYREQLGDATPTEIGSEIVTTDAPKGLTAETKQGYTFLGWYNGDTPLTSNPTLTASNIGTVSEDMTITAKYAPARVATYVVENVNPGDARVSSYGQIVVNGTMTTSSSSQTATADNILSSSATAIPMRGCEFVEWVVTDSNGRPVDIAGFNPSSSAIPADLVISEDVTFTARFKKQDGAMEIVYTIQQDQDFRTYGASLTVNGITVSGTRSTTAYISEVVPENGAALGCVASGITLDNRTFRIIGWAEGDNANVDDVDDPNYEGKDKLFSLNSTLVPVGEYLDNINGNYVRYFRAIPKWEQNVYVQLKVSIPEGGDYHHGGNYTDKIIFVSNKTRETAVDFYDTMDDYPLMVNAGYRLVGFTYNGEELELRDVYLTGDYTIDRNAFVLKTPRVIKNRYTGEDIEVKTLAEYMYYTSLFRDEDGAVENYLNILVANFEKIDSFNIQYHVMAGSGTLSNTTDTFTDTDRAAWQNDEAGYPIQGSTAIADVDNNYVFDHWEWDDEEGIVEGGDVVRRYASTEQLMPDITKLTDPDKTYHYYAVFVEKKKALVAYEPDDPAHGVTLPSGETVFEGGTAIGSTATAFDGWEFDYWTRKDTGARVSDDANFIPKVYNENDADHSEDDIKETDFKNDPETITFVAHFKRVIRTSLTVVKEVEVVGNDITMDDIDTDIYISLTKGGVPVNDERGNLWVETIQVKDGRAENRAIFQGLEFSEGEDDKYEVWEMHKVGGEYVRQYIGMLIGDDYQLVSIGASNDSTATGTGNNAILTEAAPDAMVTLTNAYSKVRDEVEFTVVKEWRTGNSTTPPNGAEVEITVYSEVDGETRAVQSVWLDGEVDEEGESEAWAATFDHLPRLAGDGRYKVRETTPYPGYTAYIDGGRTVLNEYTYMYNSGGKIINVADDTDLTGRLTIKKTFSSTDGYALSDFIDGDYTFTLSGTYGTATADVNKTIVLTVEEGVIQSAAVRDASESESTVLTVSEGAFTIDNLPVGDYALAETGAALSGNQSAAPDSEVAMEVDGRGVSFLWTVSGTGDVQVETDENEVEVINTFTQTETSIDLLKKWAGTDGNPMDWPGGQSITLTLYRNVSGETEEGAVTSFQDKDFAQTVILSVSEDGTMTEGMTADGKVYTYTISGLPVTGRGTSDAGTIIPAGTFAYYVAEDVVNGYTSSYFPSAISVNTQSGTITGKQDNTSIEITNTLASFTLPETGGPGTVPHIIAGIGLIGLALFLLLRKRAADCE